MIIYSSILANFQWYRRWRRGKWARVNRLIFGKRWIPLPDDWPHTAGIEEHW